MSGRIFFYIKKRKRKEAIQPSNDIFVTQFSVFITHNSKIVESMTKRLFGKR